MPYGGNSGGTFYDKIVRDCAADTRKYYRCSDATCASCSDTPWWEDAPVTPNTYSTAIGACVKYTYTEMGTSFVKSWRASDYVQGSGSFGAASGTRADDLPMPPPPVAPPPTSTGSLVATIYRKDGVENTFGDDVWLDTGDVTCESRSSADGRLDEHPRQCDELHARRVHVPPSGVGAVAVAGIQPGDLLVHRAAARLLERQLWRRLQLHAVRQVDPRLHRVYPGVGPGRTTRGWGLPELRPVYHPGRRHQSRAEFTSPGWNIPPYRCADLHWTGKATVSYFDGSSCAGEGGDTQNRTSTVSTRRSASGCPTVRTSAWTSTAYYRPPPDVPQLP